MGVLNVTPDSFSDGGLYMDVARAAARAKEMAAEGARIIDIGGASSRPKGSVYGAGADLVSVEEERGRILPVIEAVISELPGVWISVDTFRSEIAKEVLELGVHMINDITALRFDPQLADLCAEFEVPLVLMHSEGLPGDMPHVEQSSTDIIERVRTALASAIREAKSRGCSQLILDPGFGFGKTKQDNLRLMAELGQFQPLGYPLLIGVSRKSSVGELLATEGILPPPDQRLFGALGVTAVAVNSGATFVRTHDVRETRQFLNAMDTTKRTSKL